MFVLGKAHGSDGARTSSLDSAAASVTLEEKSFSGVGAMGPQQVPARGSGAASLASICSQS